MQVDRVATLLIGGTLFLAPTAFAKCWSAGEVPPSYCVNAQVTSAEKSPQQGCVATVKVKKFSIPRAESQSLSAAQKLKDGREVFAKVSFADCKVPKNGSELKGLLIALCNDKGQPGKAEYEFFPGEMTKTISLGLQKEFVDCDWSK